MSTSVDLFDWDDGSTLEELDVVDIGEHEALQDHADLLLEAFWAMAKLAPPESQPLVKEWSREIRKSIETLEGAQ